VAFENFRRVTPLPFSPQNTAALRMEWRREATKWTLVSTRRDALLHPPPEAKCLPVAAASVPAAAYEDLRRVATRQWLPLLKVDGDETARVTFGVSLVDGRRVDNLPPARFTPPGPQTRAVAVQRTWISNLREPSSRLRKGWACLRLW